jgi:predicted Zn-dependent peptidase
MMPLHWMLLVILGAMDVTTFDVPGGVRAIVVESDERTAGVMISIAAGTQRETADQRGAASVAAAAWLAGDLDGEPIATRLALLGVTATHTVGAERTLFDFTVPPASLTPFLSLAAALVARTSLSQAAWNEALDMRASILERERADSRGCATGRFADAIWESARDGDDHAPAPTREAGERFWRAWYTRERVVIAAEAPDSTALRHVITRAFAVDGAPASPNPVAATTTRVPRATPLVERVTASGSTFLVAGQVVTTKDGADFFAAQLVAQVLGGSLSSRLQQRLRVRERIAYTVEASAMPIGSMQLLLQVTCDTTNPSRALAVIREEFAALAARPVTGEELAVAVAVMRSRLLLDQASPRALLYRHIAPASATPDEGFALLDTITPAALLRRADGLLRPKALVAVIGVGTADGAACGAHMECDSCR